VFPNVLDQTSVDVLNDRLEHVLRGQYDRQQRPDKSPTRLLNLALPPGTAASSASFLEGEGIPAQRRRRRRRRRPKENQEHPPAGEEDRSQNHESQKETAAAAATGSHHQSQYRSAAAGPLGYSGGRNQKRKVIQIINIHKSDTLFHELVTSPIVGELVATFMGWKDGARVAQDQIWAK